MEKQRVLLTGATGSMGSCGLNELLRDTDIQHITILALDTKQDRKKLKQYKKTEGLSILWGDLTNYQDVFNSIKGIDIILHVGALVSPDADAHPDLAMKVNDGSMKNIVQAIREQNRLHEVKVVYIGTVAQTGDRRPPIHWGRVGDPIKPSIYDYYAVSKVAAERSLIESDLKYWVSLRQTGIIGPDMAKIKDAILLHNVLNNVLEYVSDRDSGVLLRNLCRKNLTGELDNEFWGHIYNIGGGETCRIDTRSMYKKIFELIGIKDLNDVIDPKWYATENFHGQYYLDSDKLDGFLNFRHDSMDYFYEEYIKSLGIIAPISKIVCKFPSGQKLMGYLIKKTFLNEAKSERGTVTFIENNMEEQIEAYWGSKENWEAIPTNINEISFFENWDEVVRLDHGYDETKPESELNLTDMKKAAKFRGGKCLSKEMVTGVWRQKLSFTCGFGHDFEASPRLVLEGGHWCSTCERESWNYSARAKVDPFFAQVWDPLHRKGEKEREYPKEVSELDVD